MEEESDKSDAQNIENESDEYGVDGGPSSPESDCYDDFDDNHAMGRDDLDNEICYGTVRGIIRGIQHYSGIVNKNEMVTLERNPNNEQDVNAIKVNNVGNVQVGHIMRELAEPLAFIMDKNLARLEALVGNPESVGYSLYLTLTLWGKQENKKETVDRLKNHGFHLTDYTIPGEMEEASGTSDWKRKSIRIGDPTQFRKEAETSEFCQNVNQSERQPHKRFKTTGEPILVTEPIKYQKPAVKKESDAPLKLKKEAETSELCQKKNQSEVPQHKTKGEPSWVTEPIKYQKPAVKKESDQEQVFPSTSKILQNIEDDSVTRLRDIDNSKDLRDFCVKHGKKSQQVVEACKRISMKILVCSRSFKDVWATYKPTDPDNVVFVVFCERESNTFAELSISVRGFNIKFCTIGEYRNEEKKLSTESHLFSETEQSDKKNLTDILRKTSSHFMQEHSNLNIISASPFKSRGYELSVHRVEKKPCIVFYVRLKGYIPIQEDVLPCDLGCYETDVREGAFTLFNTPEPFIQRLKIGCSIGEDQKSGCFGGKGGTLGAFVDLGHGQVGCITSAHALYSERQLHYCEDKKKIDNINDADTVYQPAPSLGNISGNKPFGRVEYVVYKTGRDGDTGVEAVLVTITDHRRYPDDGRFPEVAEGFTEENQLNYTSGSVLQAIPDGQCTFYKYGAATGLTRGAFRLQASAVRTNGKLDVWGNCELHNQIEVCSVGDEPFAKPGDSGSLVLLARNGDKTDLHAIGILEGGNGNTFYVTPMWEVLIALGLRLQLKQFNSQSSEETSSYNETVSSTTELDTIKKDIAEVKRNLDKEIKTVNTKMDKLESNLTTKVDTKIDKLESTMTTKVDTKVDTLETNINTHFTHLEDLIRNYTSNNKKE